MKVKSTTFLRNLTGFILLHLSLILGAPCAHAQYTANYQTNTINVAGELWRWGWNL